VWKVGGSNPQSGQVKDLKIGTYWLAFTIKGLEQGWMAQCQFNHVYLWHGTSVCWYFKTGLSLDQLQQI